MMIRTPATVYLWQNGMIMVFDRYGEQIENLQGLAKDKADNMLVLSDNRTIFRLSVWTQSMITVSKAVWVAVKDYVVTNEQSWTTVAPQCERWDARQWEQWLKSTLDNSAKL